MLPLPPGSLAHYIAVDISGPDERDDYVACGSIGGVTTQMNAFDQLWKALLIRYQVPYIRMAEAMSFGGPFKRKAVEWGSQREHMRDQILLEAAQIVGSITGQVTSHNTRDLPPKIQRPKYEKQLLFATLVRKVVYESPEHLAFVFFCDDDQEIARSFLDGIGRFRRQDRAYARSIVGFGFYDDKRYAPLQGADMVAYVHRELMAGRQSPLAPVLFKDSTQEDVVYPYTPPST
jgi:hypothetical protein